MSTMKVESFKMLFKLSPVIGESITMGTKTLFIETVKDGLITFKEGNSTARSIPGSSGHTDLYVNSEIYLKVERETCIFSLPTMLSYGKWYSGKIIALPKNGSAVIECNSGNKPEIVYLDSNSLRSDTLILASTADYGQMLRNIELKIIESNLKRINSKMTAVNYFRELDEIGLSMLREHAISKSGLCNLKGNITDIKASSH